VAHDAVVGAIKADPQGLVRSATLFDVYVPSAPAADIGVGERSVAVRVELLDDDATLTDERIEAAVAAAVQRAAAACGARMRG
jgi:phenylalanyl-tRNA synthetase beta chain